MRFVRANPVSDARFEMLRAKLETQFRAPSVIGITAAKADDGKEAAARGLADSLVLAGYATLLIDARVAGNSTTYATKGPSLEESSHAINVDHLAEELCVLTLDDRFVQQKTSRRQIESAFGMFKDKFDYIVIDLDLGLTTGFAESMVQTADAVFTCVRKGRRGDPADAQLAMALDRIGDRFVGLITLDPDIADTESAGDTVVDAAHDWHPLVPTRIQPNSASREIVRWPR